LAACQAAVEPVAAQAFQVVEVAEGFSGLSFLAALQQAKCSTRAPKPIPVTRPRPNHFVKWSAA